MTIKQQTIILLNIESNDRKELKMYEGMTRAEAIAWRMDAYGEREAVAANRVDEVFNFQPKAKKSWGEQYADMLDIMYR